MKDDLVEKCAAAESAYDGRDWTGLSSADKTRYRERIDVILAIARPAIRKEALEEAANVAEAHRPGWLSVNTAHLKQQADHIATAIRALATTGQEGGR